MESSEQLKERVNEYNEWLAEIVASGNVAFDDLEPDDKESLVKYLESRQGDN